MKKIINEKIITGLPRKIEYRSIKEKDSPQASDPEAVLIDLKMRKLKLDKLITKEPNQLDLIKLRAELRATIGELESILSDPLLDELSEEVVA